MDLLPKRPGAKIVTRFGSARQRIVKHHANLFSGTCLMQTLVGKTREAPMKRLEWLFHILAFAVQCNALVPLLARSSGTSADLGDSNLANTLAMAMTLGVVGLLVLRNPHALTEFASGMW